MNSPRTHGRLAYLERVVATRSAAPVNHGGGSYPELRLRCLHCRQTGYSGRDGIFEILPVADEIRRLISEQADSARLFDAGRQAGMRTLREAAIEKVLNGTTTVSEMVRVSGK